MVAIYILKRPRRNAKVGTQKMPIQNTKKLNVDIEDKENDEINNIIFIYSNI